MKYYIAALYCLNVSLPLFFYFLFLFLSLFFFLHSMLFTQALVTSVANVSEELPQASVTFKG